MKRVAVFLIGAVAAVVFISMVELRVCPRWVLINGIQKITGIIIVTDGARYSAHRHRPCPASFPCPALSPPPIRRLPTASN